MSGFKRGKLPNGSQPFTDSRRVLDGVLVHPLVWWQHDKGNYGSREPVVMKNQNINSKAKILRGISK